jgi:hypothetical protein
MTHQDQKKKEAIPKVIEGHCFQDKLNEEIKTLNLSSLFDN